MLNFIIGFLIGHVIVQLICSHIYIKEYNKLLENFDRTVSINKVLTEGYVNAYNKH